MVNALLKETVPSRPAQPDDAFILRMSPEILDLILIRSHIPQPLPPNPPTSEKASNWARAGRRRSDILRWNGVSSALSTRAARFIWRIVVLQSDNDALHIRKIILDTGGVNGRVGSSVRSIYSTFQWTKHPQAILQLAASCANLLRLDAPIVNLTLQASSSPILLAPGRNLRTLTLFGDTSRPNWEFDMRDLVGLRTLQHLTVVSRVAVPTQCPRPSFLLLTLVWQARLQVDAVRWLLQNSSGSLQVLMLHAPKSDFVKECLCRHGPNLLSLRLHLGGSIARTLFPELVETIREQCIQLRELLCDVDLGPASLARLPPSIQHLAVNPRQKTNMFRDGASHDWADNLPSLRRLTLWGCHARHLFQLQATVTDPWRLWDIFRAELEIELAHPEVFTTGWPFGDETRRDYVSPVVPDSRYR